MVTNLQMLAYFLKLLSIEYYLVQFWAKFGASTVSIKRMSILQTFRQSLKANFNPILPYISLHIPLRSLYSILNCSDMLLWSTVIQITQIQLSTNTHF